jgi:hypothetical protein
VKKPADKKTHKRQVKPWNQLRADEKQEYFFLVYEGMGTTRTLKRLWGNVRGLGVEISLKTLERWSADYGWQRRILERAARRESADFQDVQVQVDRMNDDHARTFQDIAALARAGISFYQAKIDAQVKAGMNPALDMEIADLVRLAESAQRGERLARGLATSKAEVIVEVLPPLVKDLFAVFLAVNVITNDPPELVRKRQSEFITRGDQVLIQYYGGQKQLAPKNQIKT